MSEKEAPKKNTTPVYTAIIVLLVVLAGTMTYLWSVKSGELKLVTAENDARKDTIAEMNSMMSSYVGGMTNDLTKDFENMLDTYDALMKKDASQADSLNVQREKIQGLLDDIKRNKQMSASQIAKLRKENETLREIMKGYVRQIDELNTLNLKLTSDLDQTSSELSTTKEERDQFKTEAEEKDAQVKKGSKLQAYGFKSTGLRMKLNDTTEPTTKARNCVQASSTFTIGENVIASAGGKAVYMQLIDPDGKTLQGRSGGTTQTDGGNIAYSAKRDIQYNNKAIDLSIFFDFNGEEPVKGNYKVKIYCDGQQIGSDSFTLK